MRVQILADYVYLGSKGFARKGDVLMLTKAQAQALIEKGLAKALKKAEEA